MRAAVVFTALISVTTQLDYSLLKRPNILATKSRAMSSRTKIPLISHLNPAQHSDEAGNFKVLVTSLIKNIVGAGLFALPSGVAAGAGLGPAIVLTVTMGALSGWMFYILGWASAETGSTTYTELWSRTVGPKSVRIIDVAVIVMAFGRRAVRKSAT